MAEYSSKSEINLNICYSNDFNEGELLGKGSFGQVFRVRDKNGREFAIKKIKILMDKDYNNSEEVKEEINCVEREISFLKEVNCEYCVKYFNSWKELDTFYIQMELCEDNLKNVIDRKCSFFQRDKDQSFCLVEYFLCIQLFREIVLCLDNLHQVYKRIHRDIKPENILISLKNPKQFIKLGDFGLVKYHEVKSSYLSHTRGVGTLRYMAPEILSGSRYGFEADYYSLALITNEIFGRQPLGRSKLKFNKGLSSRSKLLDETLLRMTSNIFDQRPKATEILTIIEKLGISKKILIDHILMGSLPNITSDSIELDKFFIKFIFSKLNISEKDVNDYKNGFNGSKKKKKDEYNIVVLGPYGSRFSSIVINYVWKGFVENYEPTIEDSYRKQIQLDGEEYVLNILDTAGMDEFTAMRDLYMKKGDGFILVYSIESYEQFGRIQEIREQIIRVKDSDKFPIILVGNICVTEDKRVISTEEAAKLASTFNNCSFYEVCVKENINVDKVFHELVRNINKYEPKLPPARKTKSIYPDLFNFNQKLEVAILEENTAKIKEVAWKDAIQCYQCFEPFTLLKRKHYCRSCGEIICIVCSKNTLSIPPDKKEVRVCDSCHVFLLEIYK